MKSTIRRGLLCLTILATVLPAIPTRAADELKSAWESLPPEAVLMTRIPAGNDFLAALRKQTKLGAVGLSQDRLDKLVAILKDQSKGQWDKMIDGLAKYNLKIEDWHNMLAGEAGFALALVPRPGQPQPLAVGLTWFEPSNDLAPRLIKAIDDEFDQHKGQDGWPDLRVDSEINGQPVTRLTMYYEDRMPVGQGGAAPGAAPDLSNMTPQQRADEEQKALKNSKTVQLDEVHVLFTRIGNRIVMANTFPQSGNQVRQQLAADPEAKIDFDAVTGLEPATALLAHFLAAQTGKGDEAGAVSSIMATPGLAEALPSGQTAFELLADPRPLIKMAGDQGNPNVPAMLKALGVDTLGPAALRFTLDGNLLRSGVFLSVPAPRTGLMTLLDQEPLKPEPPAWVPASAMSFVEVSFDLGKAYNRIKEVVVAQMGDQAAAGFQIAEAQVQMNLQVDLPTVLSALGTHHHILILPPEIKSAPAAGPEGVPPPAPGAPGAPGSAGRRGLAAPMVTQRVAVVWEVADPALWKKVFDTVTPMITATVGTPAIQEQGFTGWRVVRGGNEGGLFLGDKYLILAFGPGVSESTMAWLRTPPEGKDALCTSPIFDRAKAIAAMQPCFSFEISDVDRSARSQRDMATMLIEQFAAMQARSQAMHHPDADDEDDDNGKEGQKSGPDSGDQQAINPRELAAKLKALLPTDDELHGMFGVKYGQTVITDHGLTGMSVMEVPPPGPPAP